LYFKSKKRNQERPGKPIPEARLYFAVPGSLIFSAGMFWYGWASFPKLHWIVPALGIGCVGFGIYSIYLAVVNYLADAYGKRLVKHELNHVLIPYVTNLEKYAASALSAASLGRNVFGAFLPLATPALYQNLGYRWASSLLGFIGLALSVVPGVLLMKGPTIRAKSPFMLDSTYEDDEANERRASIAGRHTAERKQSAVLPWSDVRA
jgi:MFS family permease